MIIDEKYKKKMAVVCFLPAIAFFISLVYYLILLLPLTHGHPEPKSVVAITSMHYNTMFLLLAIASTISVAAMIVCMLHLVKIKTMTTGRKMEWVLLLIVIPIFGVFFWHYEINREPRELPIYGDIG